jgi:hypothetical protein
MRMLTRLVAALYVLLVAGSTAIEAQTCSTTIFFGNGIGTTYDDAELSRDTLQRSTNRALFQAGQQALPASCYEVAYASADRSLNGGRAPLVDILESAAQLVTNDYTHLWRILYGIAPMPAVMENAVGDAYRAASELELAASRDLQAQVTRYRQAAADGKVVVVAHSQGNLFANQAFTALDSGAGGAPRVPANRFAIVAVGTPQTYVANDGPYVTLHGDIILAVPLALRANTPADGTNCRPLPLVGELYPGRNPVECHQFDRSYMREGTVSRPAILRHVLAEIPLDISLPPPSTGAVSLTATLDGAPWAGPLEFSVVATDHAIGHLVLGSSVPFRAADVPANTYELTLTGGGPENAILMSIEPATVQTLRGGGAIAYSLVYRRVPVRDETITDARFSMRRLGQVVRDGSTLTAIVESGGEAQVLFVDESLATNEPIVYREWRVNTQAEPLSIGNPSFTWGFRPGGPTAVYTVTLLVRDAAGRQSDASATVTVHSPQLTFDASLDPALAPYFAGISFSEPQVDGDGNLRVVGYSQTGLFRMHAISSSGSLLWSTPDLQVQGESLDPIASRGFMVSPPGQSWYAGVRDRLFSYRREGGVAPGWPVTLDQPELPSGTGGWRGMLVGVDAPSSIAIAAASVTTTFINRVPSALYALYPDGSPVWPRKDFENAIDFVVSHGKAYANLQTHAVWFNIGDGTEHCRTPTPVPLSHRTIAGPAGVFSSFHETISRIGLDCSVSTVFVSPTSPELTLLGAGANTILAGEYLRPRNEPYEGSAYRLMGVSASGDRVWQQPGVVPAADSVRGVQDGIVYVIGGDPGDGVQKLFLIAEDSGLILERVPVAEFCQGNVANCGVAVGPAGALYVNDRASTRIFKLR